MRYLKLFNESIGIDINWQETESGLYKKYEFSDFSQAINFINTCADLINKENHHPKITNLYNIVEIWLITHDAGNTITEKDYDLAKQFDEIINKSKSIISLTKKEKVVLDLLKQGKSYKQIADELGISFNTANFHIKNLYSKYGVNSNIGLLAKIK
jgi:4a-hydroxytetrahydrobiopterin dehydratase